MTTGSEGEGRDRAGPESAKREGSRWESARGGAPPGANPFRPRDAELLLVEVDRFQGPLDLLLHLIRTQDVDVFDIPISRITRQFLKAIEGIRAEGLDNAGEFLEMAATLVRIKAQMLLPRHADEEDEDPRAELVRRLLEYEQIREISQRLAGAELERSRRSPKGFIPPRPRPRLEEQPLETTWDEVIEAAMGVALPDPRDPSHRVSIRPVAMSEKVALILKTLAEVTEVEFSALLRGLGETVEARMHGVMTLLAGLELSRRQEIYMRQVSPFSELWLYRPPDGAETGEEGAVAGEGVAVQDAGGRRETEESDPTREMS